MTSLFCRHNRMTAKCPICSKEMEAELRAKAPPRPAGARAARRPPRARAAPPRRARGGAGDAQARARRGRRLPQHARPGPARDRRRRAARRRAADRRRAARAARARTRRSRPSPTASRRPGSRSCSRSSGPTRPSCRRRSPRRRRATRTATPPELPAEHARADRRVPPVGGAQRLAGRRLHGRDRLVAPAPLRPRVRAARAAGLEPRDALRAARRRSAAAGPVRAASPTSCSSASRTTTTTQAAKRILLSGDKMLLERRARDLAARTDVPLAALDRALRAVGRPGHRDRAGRGAPRGDALRPRAAVSAEGARPRPWRLLARSAASPLAALAHFLPAGPTYDPWAWIIVGPRDHRVGPGHPHRPVVEAAARAVHDAVRADRRHVGARAVARDRAGRRAARVRVHVPAGGAARRLAARA